jgi:hypothetical protein
VAKNEQEARGQRAAGRQLRTLLLQVGPYRDRWEQAAKTIRLNEINQAAVCQVIAEYLWDAGERSDSERSLPRKLKDLVGRALSGEHLAPKTLECFVQAFELSPHDTQRVFDLYRGDIELMSIVGSLPPPDPDSGIRKPDHRTTLLFEHHFVGRDGLPVHHHTQQTIYSLVDGLTTYQYRIDTSEAEVRVKRGGTSGKIYAIGHEFYAVDITLPRPLRYGETQYLDYWTNIHYTAPPAPEFRRGAHQRVEHLDMRVEFHREKLPRQLWWAEWSDYRDVNSGIVEREQVSLDEERSAHRYLDAIEHTVVGFNWEW